jgi:hypothetical protein
LSVSTPQAPRTFRTLGFRHLHLTFVDDSWLTHAMAEPATVEFVDQTQRRRKLQLHDVDGQLRVNLTSALANYEAASFTRLADGLVLEGYKGSDYSAVAFKAGEEVLVEAVSRNAGGSSSCRQPPAVDVPLCSSTSTSSSGISNCSLHAVVFQAVPSRSACEGRLITRQ